MLHESALPVDGHVVEVSGDAGAHGSGGLWVGVGDEVAEDVLHRGPQCLRDAKGVGDGAPFASLHATDGGLLNARHLGEIGLSKATLATKKFELGHSEW